MAIRNILWISFEDTSPRFGCYGDTVAQTPTVDAFAQRSLLYEQATSTAPICAPSRCSIVLGLYATSVGAHHMRTSRVSPAFPDLPTPYACCPPAHAKTLSELLRAQGFYCTNNGKNDYQFGDPSSAWDVEEGCVSQADQLERAHWRNRHDFDQPFFAVFNLGWTHESGQWERHRDRVPAVTDPHAVRLPASLPDTPAGRQALAQQYDHIAWNDALVAEILQQLEDDGLADETAVFIWSDHAEGLPRRKSWPYFAGRHIPLIIHAPGITTPGERSTAPVSLIDLAPTVLSLLGQDVPLHMQGQALLGPQSQAPRRYAFGTRDRIGESYDRVRSVNDERFTYIRNFYPHIGRNPYQAYRHEHPIFQEMHRLERAGELKAAQRWLFTERRPVEELYDRHADPDEIHNLAEDLSYRDQLLRFRAVLDEWIRDTGDLGAVDEASMVRWWHPDGTPSLTAAPVAIATSPEHRGTEAAASAITATESLLITIQSATQGASIEYHIDDEPWQVYSTSLQLGPGSCTLTARAIRYGFEPSAEVTWDVTVS